MQERVPTCQNNIILLMTICAKKKKPVRAEWTSVPRTEQPRYIQALPQLDQQGKDQQASHAGGSWHFTSWLISLPSLNKSLILSFLGFTQFQQHYHYLPNSNIIIIYPVLTLSLFTQFQQNYHYLPNSNIIVIDHFVSHKTKVQHQLTNYQIVTSYK